VRATPATRPSDTSAAPAARCHCLPTTYHTSAATHVQLMNERQCRTNVVDPASQISSTPTSYCNAPDFSLPATVQPTQLSWLPVLSNVAPSSLRRVAATDNVLQTTEAAPNWPVYADVFEHPPPRLASRRSIWSDMTSVDTITQWREDWSSVGFCGQPHYCYRPHYPTASFRSPLSYMISGDPFPDRSRCTNGISTKSPSCDCGRRQTTNHTVDT